jgi:ribosomal protein S1
VYFCTPDGHVGFIDAIELSWHHSVVDKNIPSVGAHIEAVVTRVFAEAQSQGATFVASVRIRSPSGDPWCEEKRPIQGQRLSGVVILVGDGFSCVELATGAVAGVFPSPTDLELGQRVDVVVVNVDPDGKTIAAHLL